MSRLKVGDIEIDGSNVSIGGQQVTAPRPMPPAPVSTPSPLPTVAPAPPANASNALDTIPLAPRTMLGLGAGLTVFGLLWLLFNGEPLATIDWYLKGGPLISVGIGLVLLAMLKQRHIAARKVRTEAARAAQLKPHIEQLRKLLAEPDPTHSFDWIAKQLDTPRELLVEALAKMRDTGELVEELSPATNEWHYFCVPQSKSLSARLEELKRSAS